MNDESAASQLVNRSIILAEAQFLQHGCTARTSRSFMATSRHPCGLSRTSLDQSGLNTSEEESNHVERSTNFIRPFFLFSLPCFFLVSITMASNLAVRVASPSNQLEISVDANTTVGQLLQQLPRPETSWGVRMLSCGVRQLREDEMLQEFFFFFGCQCGNLLAQNQIRVAWWVKLAGMVTKLEVRSLLVVQMRAFSQEVLSSQAQCCGEVPLLSLADFSELGPRLSRTQVRVDCSQWNSKEFSEVLSLHSIQQTIQQTFNRSVGACDENSQWKNIDSFLDLSVLPPICRPAPCRCATFRG